MKLKETSIEIESSGTMKSGAFGFKWSAEMANLLSRSIYTDPILAVVREYIANAVDAHKAVNSTAAVDIHCPTNLEPHWSVRDYGPGLSQKQVMGDDSGSGLFNTYGWSDKQGDNNAIGGFGMGSKAGFAYVDDGGMFNVTSWYGGEKKTYVCHKGKNGIPEVTLVTTVASKEPNGIEIKIPVKYSDSAAFTRKTQGIVAFMPGEFKVIPSTVKCDKQRYILNGTGWGIREVDPNHPYGEVYGTTVVMGGVAYPLDVTKVHADYAEMVRSLPLVLFLPIGAVELSVSREGIMYDDATHAVLAKCLDKFSEEYIKLAKDHVESQPTYWQAVKAAENYLNFQLKDFRLTYSSFMWNGERLYGSWNSASRVSNYTYWNKNTHSSTSYANINGATFFQRSHPYTYQAGRISGYDAKWHSNISGRFNHDPKDYVIIHVDNTRLTSFILKAASETYPGKGLILIKGSKISLARLLVVTRREIPWVKASDLNYVREVGTINRRKKGDLTYDLKELKQGANWYSGQKPHGILTDIKFDFNTTNTTYYVYMQDGEYYADADGLHQIRFKYMHEHKDQFKQVNIVGNFNILIVPVRLQKLVEANPHMVSPVAKLIEYVQRYEKSWDKLQEAQAIVYSNAGWNGASKYGANRDALYAQLTGLGVCLNLVKQGVADLAAERADLKASDAQYKEVANLKSLVLLPDQVDDRLWWHKSRSGDNKFFTDKETTGILEKYPLLSSMNFAKIRDEGLVSHLKLYIEAIDAAKGKPNGCSKLSCAA